MSTAVKTLLDLNAQNPQFVAQVLGEVWPRALDQERVELARAMIFTRDAQLIARLLRDGPLQGARFRSQLVDAPCSLADALDRVFTTNDASAIRWSLAVAAERSDAAACRSIAHLLCQAEAHNRSTLDLAASAFESIVINCLGPFGVKQVSADARQSFERALLHLLGRGSADRRTQIDRAAAFISVSPGPALQRALESAETEAASLHAAIRRAAMDAPNNAVVRRSLLRWLARPAHGRRVEGGIERSTSIEHLRDVLDSAHLLRAAGRRRRLRAAAHPLRCAPSENTVAALVTNRIDSGGEAPEQQVWRPFIADYLAALGLPRRTRIELLSICVRFGEPITAQRAAHHLSVARAEFASDRFAPGAQPKTIVGHDSRFEGQLSPFDSARLGSSCEVLWTDVSPHQRIAAARRLLASSAQKLCRELIERITGDEADHVVAALALARRLGLVPRLELEVTGAVHSANAHISSAAVAALGDGETSQSLEALFDMTRHGDSRVAANAIEALGRRAAALRDERRASRIVTHVRSACEPDEPDNRARANALAVVIRRQRADGLSAARSMLLDDRPLHRISALWQARRSAASPLIETIRQLAHHDPIDEIRRRAASTARAVAAHSVVT